MLILASWMILAFVLAHLDKALALPASPQSNFTALSTGTPRQIPGFGYEIAYDDSKILDHWEFYFLLIKTMNNIGHLAWNFVFEHNPTPFVPTETSICLMATFVPKNRPSQLRAKHLVMGMYHMGSEQVRRKPGFYYSSSTTFSIAGSDIAVLKMKTKRTGVAYAGTLALASENANANGLKNGTGSFVEMVRPARRGDLFDVSDPDNPQLHVFGVFTGEDVEVEALFTASQSVIAQAAISPFTFKVGGISGTSDPQATYSPVYIEVVQMEHYNRLTYGQISQTIACLWRMFIAEKKFGSLELVVEYNMERIGGGIIKNGRGFGETSVAR